MRCVLHRTRRKTGSVRETSREVRTFGVRPVRIGFARLAHQNLRFRGRNLVCWVLAGEVFFWSVDFTQALQKRCMRFAPS